MNRTAALIYVALLLASSARAAPPPGHSALLNGMHDMQAESWLKGATPGCDKGWLTDLQYIGTSGTPGANCHSSATSAGISIIQRLDASGSESVPKNKSKAAGYGAAFASFVSQCPKIHVWIVGNEPNFTFGTANPDCSAEAYAASYVEVHKRVHALPGHGSDLVLVSPNSPYSPGCLQSLRRIIDQIKAKGVKPDGFSLHAYTQAPNGGSLNSGYVTLGKQANDNGKDSCSGKTWADTWHWNFRIYRDYINKVIQPKGLTGAPVFITESGNACTVQKGNRCYPDSNVGYFQAMYAEANAWNKSAGTKTLIRAITPYRWTSNDDGTGRDFAIGKRSKLLADLKQAFAKQYAWTKPSCGPTPPGCADDAKCAGKQICNLTSGKCQATKACGAGSSCPAGQLCREPQNDCVPRSRGSAALVVTPGNPSPGAKVTLVASASSGHTNVGLALRGPAGKLNTTWGGVKKNSGKYHWTYTAKLGGAGTHRATFTADPGKTTVYAIAYFNVGPKTPPKKDSGPPKKDGPATNKDGPKPNKDGPKPTTDGLPPVADQGQPGAEVGGGCSIGASNSGLWAILTLLQLIRRRKSAKNTH